MQKVSEWIDAGHMESGKRLFLSPIADGLKAFAVKCVKIDTYGNEYVSKVWFPKSQCDSIVDDFYQDTKGQEGYLVPNWLVDKKVEEGFYL